MEMKDGYYWYMPTENDSIGLWEHLRIDLVEGYPVVMRVDDGDVFYDAMWIDEGHLEGEFILIEPPNFKIKKED